MARIEVIIRDEAGQVLRQMVDEVALTELSLQGVESAVEQWRKQALPAVSAGLLETAQQSFTEAQKINPKCGGMDTAG
jgi:phage shock protein A